MSLIPRKTCLRVSNQERLKLNAWVQKLDKDFRFTIRQQAALSQQLTTKAHLRLQGWRGLNIRAPCIFVCQVWAT